MKINGAQGRNRTGTVFPPRDFLTSYSFRCTSKQRFVVWTFSLPYHETFPWLRQEPSSLYTFLSISNRALAKRSRSVKTGLARDCQLQQKLRFPRIWLHSHRVFPARVLKYLSPLRLPISPPGLIQDGLTFLTHSVLKVVVNDDSPPQRHLGICWSCCFTHPKATDFEIWRRDPESNRDPRICNPLHSHSAIQP